MKRFIHHDELARDQRFIRQANVAGPMMARLPDDVNAVVELFEKLEPIIEEGVRGTAAEPLYDEYGPAFPLITTNEPIDPNAGAADHRLKMRLHGIFVGELQALEGAGRSLWDFPEAPWVFKMNMARQCWDEARHVQIYEKLLDHTGGEIGMFPESTFLFDTACADDPVLRVTGVNRCLEGLACDVFRGLIDNARERGDELMAQAVDYVLADELTHVRFGSEWVREFTKNDPERAKKTKEFQMETERAFSFGGRRRMATQERLEAGFTIEELKEIEEATEELASRRPRGPKRETLMRAAELLRERHQARKRGETVPQIEAEQAVQA